MTRGRVDGRAMAERPPHFFRDIARLIIGEVMPSARV